MSVKEGIDEIRLCVLGSGAVGKSAITIRIISDNFLDVYDPTIEDNYRKDLEVDAQVAHLDILDTAGQEEFSSLMDEWIRMSKGFLLVYSIDSKSSFEVAARIYSKIERVKEDDKNIPIVLVGNKCDLEDSREVSQQEGMDLAKTFGNYSSFIEVSAKSNINTQLCFVQLVRQIRKSEAGKKPPSRGFRCTIL